MKSSWYKKFLNNLIIPPPYSQKKYEEITFYAFTLSSIDSKQVIKFLYFTLFFLHYNLRYYSYKINLFT